MRGEFGKFVSGHGPSGFDGLGGRECPVDVDIRRGVVRERVVEAREDDGGTGGGGPVKKKQRGKRGGWRDRDGRKR